MKISSVTHAGLVRERNEDCLLVKEFGNETLLLAVADGMGGHAGGECAARIAAGSLEGFDSGCEAVEFHLLESLRAANRKMMEMSAGNGNLKGMGTTLTAALVREQVVHWAHVGDSRLYLFREGYLVQVTDDHTYPGLLLRGGEISKEEARVHPLGHLLMNCLGRPSYEADTGAFRVEKNDLLLLSTDGLHDLVAEERMAFILGAKLSLEDRVSTLLDTALKKGGKDNITIILARA